MKKQEGSNKRKEQEGKLPKSRLKGFKKARKTVKVKT